MVLLTPTSEGPGNASQAAGGPFCHLGDHRPGSFAHDVDDVSGPGDPEAFSRALTREGDDVPDLSPPS